MALVLDLQASGISPKAELAVTGMTEAADRRDFIVVAPAAVTPYLRGGYTWNIPARHGGADDIAFIRDLLAQVNGDFCIDERRTFVVGYSRGAQLASELACRMPEVFAAAGIVGGLRYPQGEEGDCTENGSSVPIFALHRTDDPINVSDVKGRKAPAYWSYGIETALERRARRNGCSGYTSQEIVLGTVRERSYTGCREGAEILFYRLSGSGRVWPGSDFEFPEHVGEPERGLPATGPILDFFEAQPRSTE